MEPTKNPDVFTIGSKWPYDTKKVSFITDLDSITFSVRAGHTYNFVIILNEKTPCHIQIAASANPMLLNLNGVLILTGFAIILLLLFWNRSKTDPNKLLWCGYVAPVMFWVMTAISGNIHGNYNHFKNVVSELGAIGTKSELFTSSILILLSLLNTLFSLGFYRKSKIKEISEIPAILSFAMPVTLLWVGIFPLGNEFHGAIGPLPLLISIGSLVAFLLWRNNQVPNELRKASLFSFITMLLILMRFIKPFGIEYEGLIQRFFYVGWTIWTFAISYYLRKK